jgi:hypothetical protein
MAHFQNASAGSVDARALLDLDYWNESMSFTVLEVNLDQTLSSRIWFIQLALISILSGVVLAKCIPFAWILRFPPVAPKGADPPQVPYLIPLLGNLVSYLVDAAGLASSIT